MDAKHLHQYSKRELLELLLANQFVIAQKVDSIYSYLSNKNHKAFHDGENFSHKGELFKELIGGEFFDLTSQIAQLAEDRERES